MLIFIIVYTFIVIITTGIIMAIEDIKLSDGQVFLALSFGLCWPLFWICIVLILCSELISRLFKKIFKK